VDERDRLWFGLVDGIVEVTGEKIDHNVIGSGKSEFVVGIAESRDRRLFAATRSGLYELFDIEPQWQPVEITLAKNQIIQTIARADDDGVWIGTNMGLIRYAEGRQTTFTTENGLASNSITVVYSDRDNSLWLGTQGGGVDNRANNAVVRYTAREGLLSANSYRIEPDRAGNIYVRVDCDIDPARLIRIDEGRVSLFSALELKDTDCRRQSFFQAPDRRWWYLAQRGLRITTAPRADFPNSRTATDTVTVGPDIDKYVGIYQDPDANVWLAGSDRNLYLAEAGQSGIPNFRIVVRDVAVSVMLRDSRGILWLANNTFLGRYRDGNVEPIKDIDVVGAIEPRALFEDSKGRMWIGTRYDGVLVTEDAGAGRPHFKKLTATDGLASNSVWSIAEDGLGGIYLGTGRGVDRYDLQSGRIHHFYCVGRDLGISHQRPIRGQKGPDLGSLGRRLADRSCPFCKRPTSAGHIHRSHRDSGKGIAACRNRGIEPGCRGPLTGPK
jgi:ligand-binding sensor domain-containing protein